MDNNQCLFCQIRDNVIPSEKIYEDDFVFVIKDIHPDAPIHWLVIPKEHVASPSQAGETILGKVLKVGAKLAQEHNFAEAGYRNIINCGPNGGQVVHHLHLHILAGEQLGPMRARKGGDFLK